MSNRSHVLSLVCLSLLTIIVSAQDVTLASDMISGLPIRSIGPAAMSGRIADIAAMHEGHRVHIAVDQCRAKAWRRLSRRRERTGIKGRNKSSQLSRASNVRFIVRER